MSGKVDQSRARNRRRIQRMGGGVAPEPGIDTAALQDLLAANEVDDPRVIRDAAGVIIRRL